jgi:hypothetical protein
MNTKSELKKQIIPDDLDLIREQLYSAAYSDLAKITGYSKIYVQHVLTGRRNNQVIVLAARQLIKDHRNVLEQLQEDFKPLQA